MNAAVKTSLKITFWKSTHTSNEAFRKVITDTQKPIFNDRTSGGPQKCYIHFLPADKVLANSVYRRLRQAAPNGVFKDWNS